MADDLKEIPVVHTVTTPIELYDMFEADANDMLDVCVKTYSKPVLAVTDWASKRWLERANPEYADDIRAMAKKVGRTGVTMLNLSYEWGCTTGANDNPDGEGVRLLRALDWPVKGMGDKLVVAKHEGPAGEYYNMTYPGYVGVLNGIAKGRFSIAINIAPHPKHTGISKLDWAVEKFIKNKSNDLPAPFLLRKVFEECATYDEAVAMLRDTPLCTPALFTVAGVNKGEHAVIERMYTDARVHTDNACISNVWINDDWKGGGRHNNPPERLCLMQSTHQTAKGDFDWFQAPIRNVETVLVFEANAKTGELKVIGTEGGEPVTQTLSLKI